MRILVIGGTRFVGRAIVERLLARGHDVALLTRGATNPALFPGLPRIQADRRQLRPETLGAAAWDVVVDTCAYFPAEVETTLAALRGRVRRYVFVSTASVYAATRPYPIPEDAPLLACTAAQAADASGQHYGECKAECERILTAGCAAASIELFIGRPTVVVGPHDHKDRLIFWIEQVRRGHVVLPGEGASITHLIYAPDLGRLFTHMAEADSALAGAYNVAGTELASLRELADALAVILGTTPEVRSLSTQRLLRADIWEQGGYPLWWEGQHHIMDVARARERLGFRATPLAESLRATVDAYLAQPARPLEGVIAPDTLWALAGSEAAAATPRS